MPFFHFLCFVGDTELLIVKDDLFCFYIKTEQQKGKHNKIFFYLFYKYFFFNKTPVHLRDQQLKLFGPGRFRGNRTQGSVNNNFSHIYDVAIQGLRTGCNSVTSGGNIKKKIKPRASTVRAGYFRHALEGLVDLFISASLCGAGHDNERVECIFNTEMGNWKNSN